MYILLVNLLVVEVLVAVVVLLLLLLTRIVPKEDEEGEAQAQVYVLAQSSMVARRCSTDAGSMTAVWHGLAASPHPPTPTALLPHAEGGEEA